MEYEKCYVFEPEEIRPAKRRKIEPQGLQESWKARHKAYTAAWTERELQINAALKEASSSAVESVTDFLNEAANEDDREKIPTAILSSGPETSSYSTVVEQLSLDQNAQKNRVFISASPSSGSNLKALLKAIIQKATSNQDAVDDEDEDVTSSRKGAKLLNYDLQLLADFVRDRQLQQVAIFVGDTEAFDGDLLSELIEHLGHWRDRIPIVLLLSVATSVSSLQQRLSRSAVRGLAGQEFEITFARQLDTALMALSTKNPSLWLGADLASLVLERQTDYIQSISSFTNAAKYTYMTHYYANALSLFLIPDLKFSAVPRDHFEALRNLPSFRRHCRHLLDKQETTKLRNLLNTDEDLFTLAMDKIREAQEQLSEITPAIRLLQEARRLLDPNAPLIPIGKLYSQAVAGRLTQESSLIRSTLLAVRKAQTPAMVQLLDAFTHFGCAHETAAPAGVLYKELVHLVSSGPPGSGPLRSEADLQNTTLRTTVVAQKVSLSKEKATLSERDQRYTSLLQRTSDLLDKYWSGVFVDPKTLLFHELVVFDHRSPWRETFTPRPRHAIERALASPHDYLDCECCAPDPSVREEGPALAPSMPSTSVLYQLYLESGSLINVSDLWHAFQAVMGEEGKSEQENVALFQRALAEMSYLGLVKGTRKRIDHVAKVAWKGL